MLKFTAVFMSIISMLTMLFTDIGGSDYTKLLTLNDVIYGTTHMSEISSQKFEGEVSTEVFTGNEEYSLDSTTVLIKEKGRDFKILNIADIHLSDTGYRVPLSIEAELVMRRLISAEQPDLIILSGDIVCGDNSDYYSIRRITDIMESYGIPWAPIFGNHDDEVNCDLNYLADIMMTSPHCLMKKGDPEMGVGNYIINIAEENEDGSLNVVSSLLMMDSHHSQVNGKQIKWVKWATDGINALTDSKAEVSLFMHVPLAEYRIAYDLAWNGKTKSWNDGYKACGECNETICCARDSDGNPVTNGIYQVLKDAKTVKYVFCSHDHRNNFSLEYEGIRLTYMMKVGKSSGFQPGFNGGTVISINSDGINKIEQKTLSFGFTVTLEEITV